MWNCSWLSGLAKFAAVLGLLFFSMRLQADDERGGIRVNPPELLEAGNRGRNMAAGDLAAKIDEFPSWKRPDAANALSETLEAIKGFRVPVKHPPKRLKKNQDLTQSITFDFLPTWKDDEFANIGSNAFSGAVAAPNSRIFLIPCNSPTVIVYDILNTKTKSLSLPRAGENMFCGGVLAPNGRIYCVPLHADYVAVIDTATLEITSIPVNHGRFKWRGGALAANGLIYCAPDLANAVLVIDPAANNVRGIGQSEGIPRGAFFGSIASPDGDVVFMPWDSRQCWMVKAKDESLVRFGNAPGGFAYAGGVVGLDGCIYSIPHNADHVLVIDPQRKETQPLPGLPGKAKWTGGVLGPDGKVYCMPCNEKTILVIETNPRMPNYRKPERWGGGKPHQLKKPVKGAYSGGVLGSDGRIYFAPFNARHLLSIGGKQPLPDNWVLSPLFNKF